MSTKIIFLHEFQLSLPMYIFTAYGGTKHVQKAALSEQTTTTIQYANFYSWRLLWEKPLGRR